MTLFLITHIPVIRNSDLWPVGTDLDFLGPFYFAKYVFLSVRKIALFVYLSEFNLTDCYYL